jgi:hypothetical protein
MGIHQLASDGEESMSNRGNLIDNSAKSQLQRFANGIDYALSSIYSLMVPSDEEFSAHFIDLRIW